MAHHTQSVSSSTLQNTILDIDIQKATVGELQEGLKWRIQEIADCCVHIEQIVNEQNPVDENTQNLKQLLESAIRQSDAILRNIQDLGTKIVS